VATRRPEAAAKWKARGAKVAEVDLLDGGHLAKAFDGVDRLFLLGPQPENFGARVAEVIAAANEAGVAHIVRLSAIGASSNGAFALSKEHGIADEALAQSGVGFTILQPTFFQDNFVNYQGAAIRGGGKFYGSSGDGKSSYVSARDIGRAAANILTAPDSHRGKTYVLTGPSAHSDDEVAALIGAVTGREVSYVDVPAEQMRASMLEQGTPAWLADSMVALEGVKRAGHAAAVSPHLAQLLDGEPETLRAFLERNRGKFA
jgi:uncharacterized protein YbjT (DUF2867 family)